MAFRVSVDGSPAESHSHPGDWYEFLRDGGLAVHFGIMGRPTDFYSVEQWELSGGQRPGPSLLVTPGPTNVSETPRG